MGDYLTTDPTIRKFKNYGVNSGGELVELLLGDDGKLVATVQANTQQERFDYDTRTDGQPVYAGFADNGVLESESTWTLQKFTYNGDGFITLKQTATDSWNNRGAASYG